MSEFIVTLVKARKRHRCWLCARIIRPHEIYRRTVGFDGTAWTNKTCLHCDALCSVLPRWFGLDEYDWDVISDWDPADIGEARLKAQWKRRWERFDGTLYPLPRVLWHEDRHGFRVAVGLEAS